VPTFLWAPRPGVVPTGGVSGLSPREAARAHLTVYAPLYGFDSPNEAGVTVARVHDIGRGAIVVELRQAVAGVEVFRQRLAVVMNRRHDLIALAGYLTGAAGTAAKRGRLSFPTDERRAAAVALADMTGVSLSASAAAMRDEPSPAGPYRHFTSAFGGAQARVKPVLFPLPPPDGLRPAYYVEVTANEPTATGTSTTASRGWAYVVSAAVDGRLFFRHDLTAQDAFSYRVWADDRGAGIPFEGPQGTAAAPHPRGVPDGYDAPFVAPRLVTRASGPIARGDPWLSPSATETVGNNVDAYADVVAPDGLDPDDFRASLNRPGAFDRTYDTAVQPGADRAQQMAAITQLFYDVNFFHDWFYDVGFDEAAGNGQALNFGRGGLEGDAIAAEAQDAAGFNNANMRTPADGGRPRMQMYVFAGFPAPTLTVDQPPALAAPYQGGASLGMGPRSYAVTADVVRVVDGQAPFADACQAVGPDVAGKIVLVDRGECLFADKARNAQASGAAAIVIANVDTSANPSRAPTIAAPAPDVTIPVLTLDLATGDKLRAALAAGAVMHGTVARAPSVDRDGTLDNQVVAHEWGHFISNRLIGDGNGLSTIMSRGLGEGWGDFHALLITVQPEDTAVPGNERFGGTYPIGSYALSAGAATNQAYYFGLRRVPYSTDFSRNPLTFRHIGEGTPLPSGPPYSSGEDGSGNAEVHASGTVWATMLWECWAAILGDTLGPSPRLDFETARDRMRAYLVAAYKTTPLLPTLVEARDAFLASIFAGDPADFARCSQAFARRGVGVRAAAPDRFSETNTPVVESFVAGGDVALLRTELVDGVADGCAPADGSLDEGEIGRLSVEIKNTGDRTLSGVTAIVRTASPAVTFAGPTTLTFPTLIPFARATASVPVRLMDAPVEILELDFAIDIHHPDLMGGGVVSAVASHRAGYRQLPGQSVVDDVESEQPVWTAGGDGPASMGTWRRVAVDALSHRFLGPDPVTRSDQWLMSPPLVVASTGDFRFTFRHRYAFEIDGASIFDGGVIEISGDDGHTWSDVGAFATPPYDGVIAADTDNPLAGRGAWGGRSITYPDLHTTSMNLGTAYAGQTVRIRFRIGADAGTGGAGWEIDDIAFTNLVNRPFPILAPDPGCRPLPEPPVEARPPEPPPFTDGGPPGGASEATGGLRARGPACHCEYDESTAPGREAGAFVALASLLLCRRRQSNRRQPYA